MIATAEWIEGKQFEGRTESSHTIFFDTEADHARGPSPMEAVLTALCGCTAVDVISILSKKREPFQSLIVTAHAEQSAEVPRVFTSITLVYRVGGKVSRKSMEDAVSLSKNKYCSVSKMLEKAVAIDYAIEYDDDPHGNQQG
jgi:putative redox protein